MGYEPGAKLIDTHCHLDFPEFSRDRDEVIKRAKSEGIDYIINIGSSLTGSRESLALSLAYDYIYASVGIHPYEADKFSGKEEAAIKGLAKSGKVVAIGETGLDYFKNYSQAENQKALFLFLLKLAKDFTLPLVVHTRNAQDDTLRILKKAMPVKAVLHCFSGDENFLKECLDLGFFISFTCNITYKKAQDLKRIVKITPIDRLLLETDAPFLPPDKFRGRRNEPAYVKLLAQEVAGIKETTFEEVARLTTDNARKFFNLK